MKKIARAARIRTATEPITMPAMAPPLRELDVFLETIEGDDAVEVGDVVELDEVIEVMLLPLKAEVEGSEVDETDEGVK